MKAYLSLIRIRFLNGLQYRTAALAGIATQFAWGGLEILLFVALHSTNTDTFPMEMSALSSYIWLQQAFLALFAPWMADNELFQMVVTGNVAYELCRPLDLYRHWFCRTLALRLSRTVLRCLPILLVAALLPAPYGLSLPASPLAGLLFVLSALFGALVVASYNMLIYASAFYTTNANGMRAILSSLSDLLAGDLIPLPFFPDAIRPIVELLPFAAMGNTPYRIYSGDIAGLDAVQALSLQLFWLIAMTLLGQWMIRHAMRRVAVQGG